MNFDPFLVQVPASTSNLGSGFDTISAALSLTLKVRVERGQEGRIVWVRGWDGRSEDNILERAIVRASEALGLTLPGLRLQMDNPIPVRRGLGSSGAAIIAGIKIVERLGRQRLSKEQIFDLALPLEGHPDNLSASLLGGWVISWVAEDGKMLAERLIDRLPCKLVAAIPEITVSTEEARAALPASYSRSEAVFNLQRCALFVHALASGSGDLLREAVQDRLHQPYRARLVPGLAELLSLRPGDEEIRNSLLGVYISGSGSAAMALAQNAYDRIGAWMVEVFSRKRTPAAYRILEVAAKGARTHSLD